MAEKIKSGTAASGAGESKEVQEWTSVLPVTVDYEDAMSAEKVRGLWVDIYKKAGQTQLNETEQRGFRLAVYVYGALNGTSRAGRYQGEMVLANGSRVKAAVIPQVVGKLDIRRFFRGNMAESYTALKVSKAMQREPRYVAQAAALGVGPEEAFAMADWFKGCPDFTPAEQTAYDLAFNHGIERSRRARGGRTLEAVEAGVHDSQMEVQGPMEVRSEVRGDW